MWSGGLVTPDPAADKAERSIVITGFMGTGKSSVSRRLAARLNRRLIDTDDEIARRAGQTIPEIFAEHGEAHFRALERALCRELAGQPGLVIATGGGTLVNDDCRALMLASAFVVCLDAAPATIRRRIGGASGRPLASHWEVLFEQRRSAYASIPVHVDTTRKPLWQVVEEILRLWQSASSR
jgi:shikimate kinase